MKNISIINALLVNDDQGFSLPDIDGEEKEAKEELTVSNTEEAQMPSVDEIDDIDDMIAEEVNEKAKELPPLGEAPKSKEITIKMPDFSQINTEALKPEELKKTALKYKKPLGIGAGVILLFVLLLFLTGGSKKVNVEDYLEYTFSGMDTKGRVSVHLDTDKMLEDIAKKNKIQVTEEDIFDSWEKYDELYECVGNVSYQVEEHEYLTNGDKLKVTFEGVDQCKYLKGKSKTIEVEGLEAGKPLTDAMITENLLIDYTGVDGDGIAQLTSLFKDNLGNLQFALDRSTGLKNGDVITAKLDEGQEGYLESYMYILEGTGEVKFTVEGLKVLPAKLSDISNNADVTRLLKEEILANNSSGFFSSSTYEIVSEPYYAKLIHKDAVVNEGYSGDFDNTSLGYLVKVTSSYSDNSSYSFYGFNDLHLDDNNKSDLSKLDLDSYSFGSSYSMESMKKILESDGFVVAN